MPKPLIAAIFFSCISFLASAQTIRGVVTDTTGKPLAFATIKIGETTQGLMADLNGKFRVRLANNISFITISHLGYASQKIVVEKVDTSKVLNIELQPKDGMLEEVVVIRADNKVKRILNTALANRNKNNPDKYDWYQCKVYYKTTFDFVVPDTASPRDTSADYRKFKDLVKQQHLFMTETYSKRTWERPQKLQEDVIASRISGFKKAWFTTLVTDVLPFHSYNDFINLNGKDYHNPLSGGFSQRFDFRLMDELLNNKDTIWVISFKPKRNSENLTGTLYINSNQYAISNLTAEHYDSTLKRTVGIEQQYAFVEGKWFPDELNYFIDWKGIFAGQELYMRGLSYIDSVSYQKQSSFKFDRAHTTRVEPGADELSNKKWEEVRPITLNAKEERTYVMIDSVGKKLHFDNITTYADRLIDGHFPAGKFDIDLQRIYSYNNYEKSRVGFGLRTSKKLSNQFTLGGWFGYGFGDKTLKYGGYAEVYADRYREFKFRLSYQSDLQDPGRLQINEELDKNFIRRFLLGRVDKVKSYSFEVSKKLGYLSASLGLNVEQIIPQYNYTLDLGNKLTNSFEAREIVLNLRYAYAERMAPMLGRYFSSGTKYPILYSKIRFGEIAGENNKYLHAIAALKWQKHINKVGNEQFQVIAGGAFSQKALPLGKLFAGNGFRTGNQSFYVFGGMQTMLPYEFYSDKFINFYWSHQFDFKFYKTKLSKSFSSSPMLSFGYNMLYGKLDDVAAHKFVQFSVPDPAYHEAGMMLNRLLRYKYIGMLYVNFNAGYYYHFDGPFDHKQNGRIVFGISTDL